MILPVYNVEDYLPRCLASIARQTFQDFTVIAVNDGATDRSSEILHQFAETHPNFLVVDQENQGLAAARNTGLSLATGEYISFLDSDDFIAPTFLQELYDACVSNHAEIACCFYYYYYEDLKKPSGASFPLPWRLQPRTGNHQAAARPSGAKLCLE